MPDFMMSKFKRPKLNTNEATVGNTKSNQEPKAKFKLFAAPKQTVSKCSNPKKGVSSDISVVIRAESPLSKTVTTTMINLRGVKPKEFAQNVLNSAKSTLKALEDMLEGLEDDFTFDIEELNLSEPGCSKDTEPQRRYPKRNVAKKCYKEEEVPGEDEYLYCDVCNEEYRGSCPVHGLMLQVCDKKVPKGEPFLTSSPSESRASRGPAWAC
ncbi:unnamed protein product [Larinioides sclopetarius]|uniref:Uncharacterized protein n=1 Tax=Larinioides sclopetarius TaxID=280406 RepID=A0AAV2BUX5_9ARAC